jgi:hypothetical protein
MGVRAVTVSEPLATTGERVESFEPVRGGIDGDVEDPQYFFIKNRSNDDLVVLSALLAEEIAVELDVQEWGLWFPPGQKTRQVLARVLPTVSTRVEKKLRAPEFYFFQRLLPSRVGLYQPWVPSMDEGWTRLVLEKYGFKYTTLHNADIIAGSLEQRIDTLIIPSIEPKTLHEGFADNESDPAFVGGLGSEGADALRAFLRAGGMLVFLADSTDYAIEELHLPVKNVLKGLKTSEFYAPGSILRAVVAEHGKWMFGTRTAGVPAEVSVYFDRGQAFEIEEAARNAEEAAVLLGYAKHDPLESGWLLGPQKIEGKAALVDVTTLGGHVLLFGFRPQHRGQPHGTFRLLFNSLFRVRGQAYTKPTPSPG